MREVWFDIRRVLAEVIAPPGFDVVSTNYTRAAERLFTRADKLVEAAFDYQKGKDNAYVLHLSLCKLDSACTEFEAAEDALL